MGIARGWLRGHTRTCSRVESEVHFSEPLPFQVPNRDKHTLPSVYKFGCNLHTPKPHWQGPAGHRRQRQHQFPLPHTPPFPCGPATHTHTAHKAGDRAPTAPPQGIGSGPGEGMPGTQWAGSRRKRTGSARTGFPRAQQSPHGTGLAGTARAITGRWGGGVGHVGTAPITCLRIVSGQQRRSHRTGRAPLAEERERGGGG